MAAPLTMPPCSDVDLHLKGCRRLVRIIRHANVAVTGGPDTGRDGGRGGGDGSEHEQHEGRHAKAAGRGRASDQRRETQHGKILIEVEQWEEKVNREW